MKIAFALALVVFGTLVGCGTGVPGFPDSRLQVNNSLRALCIGVDNISSDADIQSFITLAESDRVSGITKQTQLTAIVSMCQSQFTDVLGCQNCAIAIINQVYGQ